LLAPKTHNTHVLGRNLLLLDGASTQLDRNIEVVAEGVETASQAGLVLGVGCSYAQE